MLNTLLGYASSTLVLSAASLVAGVVFSQKIKDYVGGVPSGFRTAMNGVEAKAKADIQSAIADVFAKIRPAPAMPAPLAANPAGGPAPAQPASNTGTHV